MLGSITRSLADVFTRLEGLAFTSEAKLDGQRVQIHVRVVEAEEEKSLRELVGKGGWWGDWPAKEEGAEKGGKGKGRRLFVRLFSRHLEEMTEKVSSRLAIYPAQVTPFRTDRPLDSLRSISYSTPTSSPSSSISSRANLPLHHPPPRLSPTTSSPT